MNCNVSKKFPDDLAKLIPTSSLDEIAEAFKQNNHMSRKTYDEVAAIFKKAGKKLPTIADAFPSAKKVVANTDVWSELPTKRGFAIDPMCKTYQDPSKFRGVLNRYANDLLEGANKVTYKGKPYEVKKKCLKLAFPDIPLTKVQKDVLDEFVKNNSSKFDIIITIIQ